MQQAGLLSIRCPGTLPSCMTYNAQRLVCEGYWKLPEGSEGILGARTIHNAAPGLMSPSFVFRLGSLIHGAFYSVSLCP